MSEYKRITPRDLGNGLSHNEQQSLEPLLQCAFRLKELEDEIENRKLMKKKCENCRYKVERDMPLYKECMSCKDMKHFEPKPITNRQWLENLSDKALAVEIQALGDNCLRDILDWLQAEHEE